jgi:nanoRNase/pAp phosphatase (c-di-AMP/oligoRNAs hydrolase)
VVTLSAITRKSRTSVCWFLLCQVAHALVNICSGIRAAKNVVSEADSKVQEHQDIFNKLRSALQERAVIHTEITVLRVLDAVGSLCKFSE